MTLDEYIEEQQEINRRIGREVLAMLNPFRATRLTLSGWLGLLVAVFRSVSAAREESAELGRRFYDAQRTEHLGQTSPVFLAEYDPEWFEEAMEPYRQRFMDGVATDGTVLSMLGSAIKEVENGGRRTLLRAVRNDPANPKWARVSSDGDCCAFCAVMISRGPVYQSAKSAGATKSNADAVDIWNQYAKSGDMSALDGLMARFHENCDCKAVPVFDENNWPGKQQMEEVLKLYVESTGNETGIEKLKAFRRAYDKRSKTGQVPVPLAA